MRANKLGIVGGAVGMFLGVFIILPLFADAAKPLVAIAAAGNNPNLNVFAIKLSYLLVSLGLPAIAGYGIGTNIMGR